MLSLIWSVAHTIFVVLGSLLLARIADSTGTKPKTKSHYLAPNLPLPSLSRRFYLDRASKASFRSVAQMYGFAVLTGSRGGDWLLAISPLRNTRRQGFFFNNVFEHSGLLQK